MDLKEDFSWGEQDISDVHHSKDYYCPNENCPSTLTMLSTPKESLFTVAIGAKREDPTAEYPYILIGRCSICGTKYWAHANEFAAGTEKRKFERKE